MSAPSEIKVWEERGGPNASNAPCCSGPTIACTWEPVTPALSPPALGVVLTSQTSRPAGPSRCTPLQLGPRSAAQVRGCSPWLADCAAGGPLFQQRVTGCRGQPRPSLRLHQPLITSLGALLGRVALGRRRLRRPTALGSSSTASHFPPLPHPVAPAVCLQAACRCSHDGRRPDNRGGGGWRYAGGECGSCLPVLAGHVGAAAAAHAGGCCCRRARRPDGRHCSRGAAQVRALVLDGGGCLLCREVQASSDSVPLRPGRVPASWQLPSLGALCTAWVAH